MQPTHHPISHSFLFQTATPPPNLINKSSQFSNIKERIKFWWWENSRREINKNQKLVWTLSEPQYSQLAKMKRLAFLWNHLHHQFKHIFLLSLFLHQSFLCFLSFVNVPSWFLKFHLAFWKEVNSPFNYYEMYINVQNL